MRGGGFSQQNPSENCEKKITTTKEKNSKNRKFFSEEKNTMLFLKIRFYQLNTLFTTVTPQEVQIFDKNLE